MGLSDLLPFRRRSAASSSYALRRAALVERPAPPPRLDLRDPRGAQEPLVNVAAVLGEALDGAGIPDHVRVVRARARHVAFAAADGAALRDALRAVLRAAVEAMPAGGELRLALSRQGAQVVVEVADSGAPLSASDTLDRAAALLTRCRARLSRTAVPGRGNRSRVLLAPPSPPPLRSGRAALPGPAEAFIDRPGAGR
jgi:hypothetical protein